jgi:dethiobiotin synthetase
MNKGWFITGTDTGVGKTVISTCLLRILRERGRNAIPMKPVQTGCSEGGIPDLDYAISMADVPEELRSENMAPYCYQDPCSPHLAAQREHRAIDIRVITDAFNSLAQHYEQVVAEGAGGILVPLSDNKTMLDLMMALALPVILVSRPGLGTLNHTLLSVQCLQSAGLNLGAIIINPSPDDEGDYIQQDNIKTIRARVTCPVISNLPRAQNLESKAGFDSFYARVSPLLSTIVD